MTQRSLEHWNDLSLYLRPGSLLGLLMASSEILNDEEDAYTD